MKFFDLEKKKDGKFRCKGGWLADVLLLSGGITYCFIVALLQLPIKIFNYLFSILERIIFHS